MTGQQLDQSIHLLTWHYDFTIFMSSPSYTLPPSLHNLFEKLAFYHSNLMNFACNVSQMTSFTMRFCNPELDTHLLLLMLLHESADAVSGVDARQGEMSKCKMRASIHLHLLCVKVALAFRKKFFLFRTSFLKRGYYCIHLLWAAFVCDGAKKTIMIMTGRPSFHSMKCYKYSIVHQAIDVIFYVYSNVFVFFPILFCSFDIIHWYHHHMSAKWIGIISDLLPQH